MANDCWNKATIKGQKSKLENILKKFESSENGVFHIGNYKTLFNTDVSDLDEEDWGSKRFTPSCDLSDDKLIVTGDSAWSPMIGLFETISAEYGLECDLEYEERGYDFAGKISWDVDGVVTEAIEWTYWEKLFLFDKEEFYEELYYRSEIYESSEEFVEDLNLSKWKDSSVINIEEVKKIWEKANDEN
jgi:hypothetical protein